MPGFDGIVASTGDGGYRLLCGQAERDVIVGICTDLRQMLQKDAETRLTWRLFPAAYTNDADQERFYQQMTRGGLVDSRIEALKRVEQTAHDEILSADDLEQWMAAINSVRLTLGTALEITNDTIKVDPDDPNIDSWAIYEFLSYLLMSIVHSLSDT